MESSFKISFWEDKAMALSFVPPISIPNVIGPLVTICRLVYSRGDTRSQES
jgi:hypothetical protein